MPSHTHVDLVTGSYGLWEVFVVLLLLQKELPLIWWMETAGTRCFPWLLWVSAVGTGGASAGRPRLREGAAQRPGTESRPLRAPEATLQARRVQVALPFTTGAWGSPVVSASFWSRGHWRVPGFCYFLPV